MQMLYPVLAAVAAYLIGSLSFAVIVSHGFGLSDPRSYGSGNPGATNVLRSGHKGAAVLTLLLDALKGYLPVLLVGEFGGRFGLEEGTQALVGLAAFLGHLWPVFFHFKGGKGVATAAGVLFALNPWLGLATLATWVIIAAFFRYASLASIVAAVFAPFYQLLIWGGGPVAVAAMLMGGLLVFRHRANIQKLLQGTESRLGRKAAGAAPSHAHPPKQMHKQTQKHTQEHGAHKP
jgi:glycerol-3-phosphate acyltransferase PlsY